MVMAILFNQIVHTSEERDCLAIDHKQDVCS